MRRSGEDNPSGGGNGHPRPADVVIGVGEQFRIGDHAQVDQVLADLRELDVHELRIPVARPDYQAGEGAAWYAWLLPCLAREVNVLPYLIDSSPAGGPPLHGKGASPGGSYGAFVADILDRFASLFEYVELDASLAAGEPQTVVAERELTAASQAVRGSGRRVVLGCPRPSDHDDRFPNLCRDGILDRIDVLGIHAFPCVQELSRDAWARTIDAVQRVLDRQGRPARIWISETGYSTWRHDMAGQVQALLAAVDSPAERVYWCTARDGREHPGADGDGDDRFLHLGLKTAGGLPKLLGRMWATYGLDGVRRIERQIRRVPCRPERPYVLITGGAGFIGSNLADRLLSAGRQVMILDNLSRPGVEQNLDWLSERHGDRLLVQVADIRDPRVVRRAVARADQAFNFCAQVAVTTSLVDPREDFEINARGTINLLEAIRESGRVVPLVFTSTNKVYGSLSDVRLRAIADRYEPVSRRLRTRGIDEARPLDFHSPYGCSKGTADQYVLDYARTLGQPGVVFRMSCIYGPRQFGTEDQGWVAHFIIRALEGQPITLYGDGRQVRDILFIEDLLDAFELAQANMDRLSGQAFNIGGGPQNTISLLELLDLIAGITGRIPDMRFEDWRAADQRYYVSNTSRFRDASGWSPRVSVRQGVQRLHDWLREFRTGARSARAAERRLILQSI